MGEIAPSERTVHVLLGCVVCARSSIYDEDQPHSCCDNCGLAYFADGAYYKSRRKDCANTWCNGEMYYGE